MKHKTEDYKISAVKYYLETPNSMDQVCDIFGCSKTSLYRWIEKIQKHNIILHGITVLMFPIKLHTNKSNTQYNYSNKTNRLR